MRSCVRFASAMAGGAAPRPPRYLWNNEETGIARFFGRHGFGTAKTPKGNEGIMKC